MFRRFLIFRNNQSERMVSIDKEAEKP